MPSPLHTTRFGQYLKRLLELRHGEPNLQVLEDILPVVALNSNDSPEYSRLKDEHWCTGWQAANGDAAGGRAKVFLVNDTSDQLVIIEDIHLDQVTGVDAIDVVVGATAGMGPPAGVGSGARIDTRESRVSITIPRVSSARLVALNTDAAAPVGTSIYRARPLTNTKVYTGLRGIVLRPGWAILVMSTGAVVCTISAVFRWRERTVETTELESS